MLLIKRISRWNGVLGAFMDTIPGYDFCAFNILSDLDVIRRYEYNFQ